jgi:hypothetical protein
VHDQRGEIAEQAAIGGGLDGDFEEEVGEALEEVFWAIVGFCGGEGGDELGGDRAAVGLLLGGGLRLGRLRRLGSRTLGTAGTFVIAPFSVMESVEEVVEGADAGRPSPRLEAAGDLQGRRAAELTNPAVDGGLALLEHDDEAAEKDDWIPGSSSGKVGVAAIEYRSSWFEVEAGGEV